jgi:hypothetical protein
MSEELMAQFANQGPAFALAVWVILEGRTLTRELLTRQEQSIQTLLAHYEKNQAELMALLKTLCLPKEGA